MKNKIAIPIIVILSIVVIGFVLYLNNLACYSKVNVYNQIAEEHNSIKDLANCVPFINKTMVSYDNIMVTRGSLNTLIIFNNKDEKVSATATISLKSNNVECTFQDTAVTTSDKYSIPPNEYRTIKIIVEPKLKKNKGEYRNEFCEVTINTDNQKEKLRFNVELLPNIERDELYYCL